MPTKLKSTGVEFPDGTTQTTKAEGDIPSGTRMVFYQAAAPTGWTQVTAVNDRVLRVVSGAGGGTGGSWTISGLTRGSLSVDGHTLTEAEMPSHSHGGSTTTDGGHSHSGSTSQNGFHGHSGSTSFGGNHFHSIRQADAGRDEWAVSSTGLARGSNDVGETRNAGGHSHSINVNGNGNHTHSLNINANGDHSHSLSISAAGSDNAHTHGLSGTPGHSAGWRPSHIDVIVAEKD